MYQCTYNQTLKQFFHLYAKRYIYMNTYSSTMKVIVAYSAAKTIWGGGQPLETLHNKTTLDLKP